MLSSTLLLQDDGRPFHVQQADQIAGYLEAYEAAGHAGTGRTAVTRSSFVIQDLQKQLKYPLDQSKEFTPEAAEEQVSLFLDHKLQPELKSQPIPDVQDEPVFNLVSKQFEEVVFDDDRDVFVEFYASWYVCVISFRVTRSC